VKGSRVPHWGLLELKYSISELVVHGARNQPSERSGIVMEIYLPDIFAQSQNSLLIFQRTDHRFGRSTEIRRERQPFGMGPFPLGFFRHVDYNDGTVHGRLRQMSANFLLCRMPGSLPDGLPIRAPPFRSTLISIKYRSGLLTNLHRRLFWRVIEMTRYVVKFFKEVMGDNGHEAETCQGTLEVDAPSSLEAVERGKREFCDHERLAHWSLHADRVSVEETEYPS
jgi:hypothetical protein